FDAAEQTMRRIGNLRGVAAALRGQACVLVSEGKIDKAVEVGWESVRVAERQAPPVDKVGLVGAYVQLAYILAAQGRQGALAPAQRGYTLARELHSDRPTPALLEAQSVYLSAL